MEAHGGRIRAESSRPGRGTTITFTLPAAEAEDRAASVHASASRGGRDGTAILLVDPHALRRTRDALAAAGYAPATAAGPGEVARLVSRPGAPRSRCSTSCCPAPTAPS